MPVKVLGVSDTRTPVRAFTSRDRARFVSPAQQADVISRSRLDHAYAAATGGILRVLAPGGYGKSTQVAGWVAADDRHTAWVDLEPIDNDPSVLATTLARALAPLAGRPLVEMPAAPGGTRAFADQVIPTLGAVVRDVTEPFVLVLDDVHEVIEPDAGLLIDAVAANLPAESTLVLVGRAHRVDAAIGRLRLRPGVTDVLTDDLALDDAEAGQLLSSMGIAPDSDALTPVLGRFAGWPAGLRLAGMVISAGGEVGEAGDARLVTDYLRSEWIATLAPDDADFLRGAACLGRFRGDLCDDALDTTGSSARLRRLQREAQLVLPLDQRDEWFRMHPVLAQWLESELRETAPERWREIHRSASQAAETAGDIDVALRHARQIDDVDTAERLVDQYGPAYLSSGSHDTIGRWFSMLPPERIHASPSLCALGLNQALQEGDADTSLVWAARLQRIAENATVDPHTREQAAAMSELFRATLDRGRSIDLAEMALRAGADPDIGPWRAVAQWVAGSLLFLAGDERAGAMLDEAATNAIIDFGPQFRANTLATRAIVAELIGGTPRHRYDPDEARARQRAGRFTISATAAPTTAMNALAAARQGRHELASDEMSLALAQAEGLEHVGPWFNVLLRLALARTCQVLGDTKRARSFLDDVERFASAPDAPGTASIVAAMRVELDSAGVASLQLEPLTSAEVRVLEFLPTNLSLAEIARRLFVSRNTVKTHAAAIYRKFGASSRGEAVDLAREAGLLDRNGPA